MPHTIEVQAIPPTPRIASSLEQPGYYSYTSGGRSYSEFPLQTNDVCLIANNIVTNLTRAVSIPMEKFVAAEDTRGAQFVPLLDVQLIFKIHSRPTRGY